jgi:hypothetical protein
MQRMYHESAERILNHVKSFTLTSTNPSLPALFSTDTSKEKTRPETGMSSTARPSTAAMHQDLPSHQVASGLAPPGLVAPVQAIPGPAIRYTEQHMVPDAGNV